MAIKKIPVRSDIASYKFLITLDGEIFRLAFKFNSRMNLWIMDVYDSNEVAIIVGRPLFSLLNPFRIFAQEELPDGVFNPLNLEDALVDATEDTLGEAVKLFYIEAS